MFLWLYHVRGQEKEKEGVSSWYYCLKRMSRGRKSEILTISAAGNVGLQNPELLQSIKRNPCVIQKFAEQNTEALSGPDPKVLASKINTCQTRIDRLYPRFPWLRYSSAQKYILAELERLDLEIQALRREHNLALAVERKRSLPPTRTRSQRYLRLTGLSVIWIPSPLRRKMLL